MISKKVTVFFDETIDKRKNFIFVQPQFRVSRLLLTTV